MAEVPIMWKQASMPFTCGIVFRVGRADETATTGGITHLVEHLSLPTRWPPEVDFNASVDPLFTQFWFAGPQKPTLAMLSQLTRDLVDLPFVRLPRERSILKAESSWRGSPGVLQRALMLRFGAAGHGQTALYEYGLEWVGRPELRAWVARGFGAANARAYMSARPPDGYRLELPRGRRQPPPRLQAVERVSLPAVSLSGPSGVAAVSMLVERSPAASMVERLATRRLTGLLRHRLGVTYTVGSSRNPLSRQLSHLLLTADARDRDVDAVARGVLVVLDELAARGPTDKELAHDQAVMRRELLNPLSLPNRLWANARADLDGTGVKSRHELLAGAAKVSADDVRRVVARGLETAILVLPDGAAPPAGRFSGYPTGSESRVRGRRYAEARDDGAATTENGRSLVAGPHGVMLDHGDGRVSTVAHGDCVARVRWGNGIELWGRDGVQVWVDPAEWEDGEAAVARIEAAKVGRGCHLDVRRSPALFDDADLTAGLAHYVEERWAEAVEALERGLERAPDEPDAWGFLAWSLDRLGQRRRAIAAAERATALDPVDDWAPQFAAGELADLGRTHDAARLAREALRRNPTRLTNVARAAIADAADGRLDEADRLAARALELFPGEAYASIAAAAAARARGDLGAALEHARSAVGEDGDAGRWHVVLAELLLETRAAEDALSEIVCACELAPEAAEIADPARAVALALVGRTDEAAAVLAARHERAVAAARDEHAANPDDPATLLALADALAGAPGGDAVEGLALAERAIAGGAAGAWPLLVRARLALALGDAPTARRSLAAAGRAEPGRTDVLRERALLAALTGAADDGLAAAAEIERLRPGSRAEAFARACAAVAAGRRREALKAAQAAVARDPLSCCAHAVLGIALAQLGRQEGAQGALVDARARATHRCSATDRLDALVADAAPAAR